MIEKLKRWFWNILISIDQMANTFLWGDPDETLSSRMGKMVKKGTAGKVEKTLCEVLDKIDDNHCEESIEHDEGKDEVG